MKNVYISKLILDKVNAGLALKYAFDDVLGSGAYQTLVDELYQELRA